MKSDNTWCISTQMDCTVEEWRSTVKLLFSNEKVKGIGCIRDGKLGFIHYICTGCCL